MSKSPEIRDNKHHLAGLPILSYRGEIIDRLLREKVLGVKAETGSGKTTQLPQYCAVEPD